MQRGFARESLGEPSNFQVVASGSQHIVFCQYSFKIKPVCWFKLSIQYRLSFLYFHVTSEPRHGVKHAQLFLVAMWLRVGVLAYNQHDIENYFDILRTVLLELNCFFNKLTGN